MSEIQFVDLGPGDYDRAKSVLNKARHPGFVGRELFFRCATTGKATVAVIDGVDSAVMLVAKQRIEALSVVVAAQGRGVGQALVSAHVRGSSTPSANASVFSRSSVTSQLARRRLAKAASTRRS